MKVKVMMYVFGIFKRVFFQFDVI